MIQQLNSDDFLDAMFGNDPNEDAYYEEDQDVKIEDGTYPALIVGLTTSNVITRKGTHADLYKPVYEIAKGNYKGSKVSDKGIWRFRSNPSKTHNRSNRGNVIYKNVLDILQIGLEEVERDGRTMKRLPELTEKNIVGKTVLVSVQDDDYKSDYGRLLGKVAIIQSIWSTNGSTVSEVSTGKEEVE